MRVLMTYILKLKLPSLNDHGSIVFIGLPDNTLKENSMQVHYYYLNYFGCLIWKVDGGIAKSTLLP